MARGRCFFPWKSSSHRIACISLYRHLLHLASSVPLPEHITRPPPPSSTSRSVQKPTAPPLRHLIRKQFRRNQYNLPNSAVIAALKQGYIIAEFLHRASLPHGKKSAGKPGDDKAHIGDIVATATTLEPLETYSQNPAWNQLCALLNLRMTVTQSTPRSEPRKASYGSPAPYPGAPKVLDTRPLPLSQIKGGRRKLPAFTITSHGLPFLRLKKPQSSFLSRVLRDKTRKRRNRMMQKQEIEEWEAVLAKQEGEWDRIVGKAERHDKGGWTKDVGDVLTGLDDKIVHDFSSTEAFGQKLFDVWKAERKLFVEERAERRSRAINQKLDKKFKRRLVDKSKWRR